MKKSATILRRTIDGGERSLHIYYGEDDSTPRVYLEFNNIPFEVNVADDASQLTLWMPEHAAIEIGILEKPSPKSTSEQKPITTVYVVGECPEPTRYEIERAGCMLIGGSWLTLSTGRVSHDDARALAIASADIVLVRATEAVKERRDHGVAMSLRKPMYHTIGQFIAARDKAIQDNS